MSAQKLATQNECFAKPRWARLRAHGATFRLLLGVPGPSSALAGGLATRPARASHRARQGAPADAGARFVETALRELARERAELEALRHEAERERQRETELREALETERHAFREQAAREVEQEVRELRTSVRAARKELDGVRSRIRATPSSDAAALRELERGLSRVAAQVAIGGQFAELAPSVAATPRRASSPARAAHRADGFTSDAGRHRANHRAVRTRPGTVDGRRNEAARPVRDFVVSQPRAAKVCDRRPRRKPKANRATQPKPTAPPQRTQATTLDLRGERVDEALGRVDRIRGSPAQRQTNPRASCCTDTALAHLKNSVREHLRASTYVEHSRPAESDEGGDAFTVFWLRG